MKKNVLLKMAVLALMLVLALNSFAQWEQVSTAGMDTAYLQTNVFFNTGSRIFLGVDAAGVYMTDDNGDNWVAANNGLSGTETVKGFAMHGGLLYVALNRVGIYVTDPVAVNWTMLTGATVNPPTNQDYTNLTIIGDTIYIGTKGSSVYAWVIGGNDYVKLSNPTSSSVLCVANDNGRLIVGLDNVAGFNAFNHDTKNWTKYSLTAVDSNGVSSLWVDDTTIYAVAITKKTNPVPTPPGVFTCTSGIYTWTKQNLNGPNSLIHGVNTDGYINGTFIKTIGTDVVLGTSSNGLWQSSTGTTLDWHMVTDIQQRINDITYAGLSYMISTSKGVFIFDGSKWVRKSSGLPRSTFANVKRIREYAGKYYAMTTSGMYVSTTGTDGWTLYGANSAYKTVTDIANITTGMFASMNGYLYKWDSTDWVPVPGTLGVNGLFEVFGYEEAGNSYLFAAGWWHQIPVGIARSADGGNTWTFYNTKAIQDYDSAWADPLKQVEGLYVGTDYRYTTGPFSYDTLTKTLFTNGKFQISFSQDNGLTWYSRRAIMVTQNVRYNFARTYKGQGYFFHGAQNDGNSNRAVTRSLINDTVIANGIPKYAIGQSEGSSMADYGEDLLFFNYQTGPAVMKSEDNGDTWVPFTTNLNFDSYSRSNALTRAGDYLYLCEGNGDVNRYDLKTPPVWNIGYPKAGIVTPSSVNLMVSNTRPGTAYYVVLPAADPAPSDLQVIAGQDASGIPVALKGSFLAGTNTVDSAAVVGLNSGTAYKIYTVVRSEVIKNTGVQVVEVTTPVTVTITVLDADDSTAIAGADVTYNSELKTTNASGVVAYVVAMNTYAYSITATNYDTASGNINAALDVSDTIYLNKTQYAVTLTVIDTATMQPINGVKVTIGSEEKTAAGDGIVNFSLVAGNYAFTAVAALYDTVNGNITVTGPVADTIYMEKTVIV